MVRNRCLQRPGLISHGRIVALPPPRRRPPAAGTRSQRLASQPPPEAMARSWEVPESVSGSDGLSGTLPGDPYEVSVGKTDGCMPCSVRSPESTTPARSGPWPRSPGVVRSSAGTLQRKGLGDRRSRLVAPDGGAAEAEAAETVLDLGCGRSSEHAAERSRDRVPGKRADPGHERADGGAAAVKAPPPRSPPGVEHQGEGIDIGPAVDEFAQGLLEEAASTAVPTVAPAGSVRAGLGQRWARPKSAI